MRPEEQGMGEKWGLMKARIYEWNEDKNLSNIKKHGLSFEIAMAVFDDPMVYEYYDKEHSGYDKNRLWEDRYIAIGCVNKVLFVVYSVKQKNKREVYRIISARKATIAEINLYEDWCNAFL